MKRSNFIEYIRKTYNSDPEFLWIKSPSSAIFRHTHNKKWFLLITDIPTNRLIHEDSKNTKILSVINLKAQPELIGALRKMKGIYAAYHMNKSHWISINLDELEKIDGYENLIEESFNLTK